MSNQLLIHEQGYGYRPATDAEVAEYMRDSSTLNLPADNRIIDSDSYKACHWLLYPPNTTSTFSYLEARGSEREYTETVFFGLQYILKRYFSKPITLEEVEEARGIIEAHGEPFNYEGWKLLVERHGGKLPLRIRAVAEGTIVPVHNALMTVETTDPDFFWLASYFETVLMRVWYPITVATQSYYLKKLIYDYLDKTADDADAEIAFKLHDFGSRGVSSKESAGLGGLAHLVSFMGTDTMEALRVGRDYYHEPVVGFSIPAGEHSTFSSWGKDRELDAYRNMLKQFGQAGKLLAVVSDTWDIYNACEKLWGEELRQEVIDSGATVVIRPDSGDPVKVLCGHTYLSDDSYDENGKIIAIQRRKGVFDILAEKFGYTTNSKGYKVLNNVRVIQGDGVNPDSIREILETMEAKGFSATNIAFGMGGALLQKVNRDTLKMAYKCSSAVINGRETDVYKDPVTDIGKRSKKGRLDLVFDGGFATERLTGNKVGYVDSAMRTVFENGEVLADDDLATIRKRATLTKRGKYAKIGE